MIHLHAERTLVPVETLQSICHNSSEMGHTGLEGPVPFYCGRHGPEGRSRTSQLLLLASVVKVYSTPECRCEKVRLYTSISQSLNVNIYLRALFPNTHYILLPCRGRDFVIQESYCHFYPRLVSGATVEYVLTHVLAERVGRDKYAKIQCLLLTFS